MHFLLLRPSIVTYFAPFLTKVKCPTETCFSGVWSVLRIIECGVQCGMLNVVCNAVCGMLNVMCNVVCGMLNMVCNVVWYVECGVHCGMWYVE